MANKLVVAPAPHVQTSQSTARIMRDVVIALMPALAVSAVVFGVDVLRVTALSVAACVLFEYLIQKFLVRGASTIGNWSAVVTGVLLAFNLPASIPWWIVLIMSNLVISLIKNIIPDKVRIPAFIVVIASFVTVIQMLMQAYVPALYASLGVFIPLIVVNCIILGRAEAFASKNSPLDSILDGVGIGLGFTLALTAVGAVREILGSGAIFGVSLGTADFMPLIFVLAPGAFLVLGYLMVLFNKLAKK